MPIPQCTLHTTRPTPTTISFTVTTRSGTATLTSRALNYGLAALRIVVAAATLLVLWAKWEAWSGGDESGDITRWVMGTGLGEGARRVADAVPSRYLLPTAGALLWAVCRRGYTEESLLVLRGLGIQTTSSSPTYLSSASTRFIPTTAIQDIFIHEAFKGFEVRFYLAIVVKGEQDLVVVFPNLLPSLSILEEVWRGARSCLYEPKS